MKKVICVVIIILIFNIQCSTSQKTTIPSKKIIYCDEKTAIDLIISKIKQQSDYKRHDSLFPIITKWEKQDVYFIRFKYLDNKRLDTTTRYIGTVGVNDCSVKSFYKVK